MAFVKLFGGTRDGDEVAVRTPLPLAIHLPPKRDHGWALDDPIERETYELVKVYAKGASLHEFNWGYRFSSQWSA